LGGWQFVQMWFCWCVPSPEMHDSNRIEDGGVSQH